MKDYGLYCERLYLCKIMRHSANDNGLKYDNSFTCLCCCPVPRRARVRGGAELLGGSHVIISMQATAISMQMPGSGLGPGGELLFIILLARGAHTGCSALLITALVLCNSP